MEDQEKLKMKIEALKEGFADRIGRLSMNYEDVIANLRVSMTELNDRANELHAENNNLRQLLSQRVEDETTQDGTSESSN